MCIYNQLIFDKWVKIILWRKDNYFTNGVGRTGFLHQKYETRFSYLSYYTKIKSQWIKNLNLWSDIILLQESMGETLKDTGIGTGSLNNIPQAHAVKAEIDKTDYIKLRSICTTKETVSKLKRQWTKWERIFAKWISGKELIITIF